MNRKKFQGMWCDKGVDHPACLLRCYREHLSEQIYTREREIIYRFVVGY